MEAKCNNCGKIEDVKRNSYASIIGNYGKFLCTNCREEIKEQKRKQRREQVLLNQKGKFNSSRRMKLASKATPSDEVLDEYVKTHNRILSNFPPEGIAALLLKYPEYPLREAFLLYKLGLKERPKCPVCGNEIVLKTSTYGKTCNKRCAVELTKQTNLEKYGGPSPACSKEVQNKMKATSLRKYGVESGGNRPEGRLKCKQTCLQKYGVTAPAKSEVIKAKMRATCLERYGVENPNQSVKARQSCLERYGVGNRNLIGKDLEKVAIWKDRGKLEDFIKNSNAPYYEDLAEQLDLTSYGLRTIVHNFNLQHLIQFRTSVSKAERDIADYIKTLYNGEVRENVREIISPYELDIYIPEKKLAIEFNGTYWHGKRDSEYYQTKSLLCREKGIHLIHIFEHEWDNEEVRNKIKLYIKDIFNTTPIYARKCEIREVPFKEAKEFLNVNHLQGTDRAPVRYGLYFNEELVSIMTFSKPRFNKNYEWELSRFATKFGYRVIGGASKLFKHFKDEYNPSNIISYCDLGKMRGNLYPNLEFKEVKVSEPNYVWVKENDVKTRYQCQLHNLKKLGYEGTETSIMEELGYIRIYNSGNIVFEYISS